MKKILLAVMLLGISASRASALQLWGGGNANFNKIQVASITQVTVSTTTPINPTATYIIVESTGGTVNFTGSSSYPAISTSTAVDGQWLVLMSTQATNIVAITTGTATGVVGHDATITLTYPSKGAVSFIYNAILSAWVEISAQ